MQTVYDVFAVAPLGAGVVDPTAGSTLVTGYFTGQELKNLLEFLLVDSPAHPGEYFPRASGMRFRYDPSRPKFDVVTAIELGDLDRGYKAIDISGKDERLYSLTCPLMLAPIIVAIPKYTKGKLALVPKNKDGTAAHVEGRGARRASRQQLALPAAAAGHDGHDQCRHRNGEERRPRDQGMAGDHGSPAQAAGQEARANCR